MTETVKKFISYISVFSITLIFFLGKRFALIDVPLVPGFILDFLLLMVFIFCFKNVFKLIRKESNYLEIGFFVYLFLALLMYTITTNSTNLNELGQDILIVIYPVFIYFIYKITKPNVKFSQNIIKLFLVLYSIYLILDFTFERAPVVTDFLGINFIGINVLWINMAILKPTEAIFFVSILVFLDIKLENKNHLFLYIIPGILYGLNMTDSRTILYGSLIFFVLIIIENKNQIVLKKLVYLTIGILLSFTFVITEDVDLINKQIDSQNFDVGIGRVRTISAQCFLENVLIKRDKELCEKRQSGYKDINVGHFIQSKNQGFSTPSMEALITLSKEIENTYSSIDSFNSDVKKCYQNGEFLQSCNDDQVNLYFEFIDLRNKAYNELCGDNITWRLNLWQKSIFNNNVTITNFIFGHGIGYSIPKKLTDENQLPIECYVESLESSRPLRNSHNTFITFFYRFGIINLTILSLLLLKVLTILVKNKSSSIIIFALIISFLDPILDSPISLLPFSVLLFILLDSRQIFNTK
jgi:hypothetical protein